ncbi:MAG TPA: hypothetical protein PKX07_11040 [Aggregatilineales bacterium]|nr:hypothetical protein [Aggregatilineales bacterium]
MQGDYILLLTVIFSVLLLLIQRTERKSRFKVFLLVAITAGALMYYVIELRQIQSEALIALVIALVVNWLFYVVIGRYNPVKNSDDTIKVIGMDE